MRETENNPNTLALSPHKLQFVIDELPWLILCPCGFIYAGMEQVPLSGLVLSLTVFFSLCLLYRFLYLQRIRYYIGSELIISEHGIFQRSTNYIELFRVVDFHEHRSLMQQLFGLKTVTIFSMDRTTPRLELLGISDKKEVVSLIRERVEYNKRKKGIYEITNH